MKQTAVELFIEQLEDYGDAWENVSKQTINISIKKEEYRKLKKQAKEIEKENIKKGWLQDRDITFGDWQQEFEQWYSQEFKQQEQ